jgi:hypothetical protein
MLLSSTLEILAPPPPPSRPFLFSRRQVKPSQVAAEARRVPESGLGIDALFRSLLQAASPGFPGSGLPGGAGGNAPGAGGDQAEDFRRLFE